MNEHLRAQIMANSSIDDIIILDESSDVTGGDIVLYPSEEKLAANLSEIGYDMPERGMYTVEEFLDRVGTDERPVRDVAELLMDLAVQATLCLAKGEKKQPGELDMVTVQALVYRFAKHIAAQE